MLKHSVGFLILFGFSSVFCLFNFFSFSQNSSELCDIPLSVYNATSEPSVQEEETKKYNIFYNTPTTKERCPFAFNMYNNFARQRWPYHLKVYIILDTYNCKIWHKIAKRDHRIRYFVIPSNWTQAVIDDDPLVQELNRLYVYQGWWERLVDGYYGEINVGWQRNGLIDLSRGAHYVFNLDSDDFYFPDYTRKAVKALDKSDAMLAFMGPSQLIEIHSDGSVLIKPPSSPNKPVGAVMVWKGSRLKGRCSMTKAWIPDTTMEEFGFLNCIQMFNSTAIYIPDGPVLINKLVWGRNTIAKTYKQEGIHDEGGNNGVAAAIRVLRLLDAIQGNSLCLNLHLRPFHIEQSNRTFGPCPTKDATSLELTQHLLSGKKLPERD